MRVSSAFKSNIDNTGIWTADKWFKKKLNLNKLNIDGSSFLFNTIIVECENT